MGLASRSARNAKQPRTTIGKTFTTVGFEPMPENALKSEGRRLSTQPNSRYRLNVNIIMT